MKYSIAFVTVLLISFAGTAQTKRIAYRSHSGASQNFITVSEDNFGLGPEQKKAIDEARAKRDSTEKAAKDSAEKAAAKEVAKHKKEKRKQKHL